MLIKAEKFYLYQNLDPLLFIGETILIKIQDNFKQVH